MPKTKKVEKKNRLGGVEHGHRCPHSVVRKKRSKQQKKVEQCNRWTVATGPYCWQHTVQRQNLKVKPSTVAVCGMGLFACKSGKHTVGESDIVFAAGDNVATFGGQWYPENHPKANGDYALSLRVAQDEQTGQETWETLNGEHTDSGNARYANSVGGPANIPAELQNSEITQWGHCSREATLVATRDIRDGEEIFCDYGVDYTF